MNLSVKNMIFAFVTGLVVFSLIMAIICVGMFNSEIKVAQSDVVSKPDSGEKVGLDGVVVFKVTNNGEMNFIVLAMVDCKGERILLTPVYSDYLIPYKNALSYVSNVYLEMGDKMIPEAIKAFSGLTVDKNEIVTLENVVNYEGFKAVVLSELAGKVNTDGDISSYRLEALNVALTENSQGNIKQIDIEKSVEHFKTILG